MRSVLFLFIFTSFLGYSQNFSSIKEVTRKYPKYLNAEKLAKRIASDFKTHEQQVKATFYWISKNISYDLDSFHNSRQKRIHFSYRGEADKLKKIQEIKDGIVHKTFINRKAVCEGYAQTFSKICTLLNIKNSVIKGYVRNSINDINNIRNITNHAWNAVKIKGKWIYLDATWAAGFVYNNKWVQKFNSYYYNITEDKYFKTHFPESKLWQLRVSRISKEQFYNQPIYNSNFLNSNLDLISPKTGLIKKRGVLKFKIRNLKPTQKVLLGFSNYKYANKPNNISFKNNVATIEIIVPKNSKGLFLIIDGEVVLEFLIE